MDRSSELGTAADRKPANASLTCIGGPVQWAKNGVGIIGVNSCKQRLEAQPVRVSQTQDRQGADASIRGELSVGLHPVSPIGERRYRLCRTQPRRDSVLYPVSGSCVYTAARILGAGRLCCPAAPHAGHLDADRTGERAGECRPLCGAVHGGAAGSRSSDPELHEAARLLVDALQRAVSQAYSNGKPSDTAGARIPQVRRAARSVEDLPGFTTDPRSGPGGGARERESDKLWDAG